MLKYIMFSLLLCTSSLQGVQFFHARPSYQSECGRAFGEGWAQGIDQNLKYQMQLRYQREMMEMLREQIRWEMENAK